MGKKYPAADIYDELKHKTMTYLHVSTHHYSEMDGIQINMEATQSSVVQTASENLKKCFSALSVKTNVK